MHECPSCAQRLPDDVAFCPHCGAPVLKEQADATADPDATVELRTVAAIDPDTTVELPSDAEYEPTAPLAAEGTPTQFMMPPAGSACPACGAATASDDRFCPRCGAALSPETPADAEHEQDAAETRCVACGTTLAASMLFCPHCGARRGDGETAASREETIVAPSFTAPARGQAEATMVLPPSPPPPPPPASAAADKGRRSWRTAIIAGAAVAVLAATGFCVWWFVLRDASGAARQDFVRQATTILQPVAEAQRKVGKAIGALDADDDATFATLRTVVDGLSEAVADAQKASGSLDLDEAAEPLRAKLKTALATHQDYADSLAAFPEEAADLTRVQVDLAETRTTSARSAYASLAAAAPGLPAVAFAAAAHEHLADVQAAAAKAQQAVQAQQEYLQQLSALFQRSRAEREAAEQILAQFESVELPPDNASGKMKAAAANLTSVLAQIDALVPPQDPVAERLQRQYYEAVQHWAAAAQQYAKWMWTAHQYYQAGGWYPTPEQGHEADLYLDPAYNSAHQEQELADSTRAAFATAYNKRSAEVSLPANYDATSM